MLNDILLEVRKPARYIGGEWNISRKDFNQAYIKFALCFPDLYEVGMSNLGIRIIYGILNNIPDVVCERFFACDVDMEEALRKNRLGIFSLESCRQLREFDIIGFSLASELTYTNVLNILDLGNIPLKANLRNHAYPLVIAGGPCVLNPEPMHEFFDLFIIGEGEDLIPELIEIYRKYKEKFKAAKLSKFDLLLKFCQIEGVYVPSLYEAKYNPEGKIEEFKPKIKDAPSRIKKRYVKDLNTCFFPLDWLVSYVQLVHDRIVLEIMRGCPNRCRFCQSRLTYFPLRIRDIQSILDLASRVYERTGYEEISLAGLSVSDYPKIQELSRSLIDLFKTKVVAVSLPSIKARSVVGEISSTIASIKKTGLTFAPEAGSERLRNILAKDFDEQGFYQALEEAFSSGYQHVKLYFMIGLPHEEDKDLDSIIELSTRVSELRRKVNKYPARVNISINTLIPKPHTPLQWFKMESPDAIRYKQNYLKSRIKNKRLNLGFHNSKMSFLEGVLSRGDRRLSQVILGAFKKKAKFDAWGNHFAFDLWQEAFKEAKIEPDFYLKEKTKDEILPWDFLDVGINKEFLWDEFNKVIAKEEDKDYNQKIT
jgi:radical SAM family uncharacterized protein